MPVQPRHWLPGLIAGQGFIHSSGAACTLDYGETYPFGLLAQISVRFRGPLSLEQQREISRQSESYLRNKPASGPQLILEHEGTSEVSAQIITHEGHNTMWTFTYWVQQTITPSALSLTFNWAAQDMECGFAISAEKVRHALEQAKELWSPDPEGYFSA